jgi:homoserine kinase
MNDRLHEPYRIPLVPGLEEVKRRALGAGAFSAALSGAGPTVIAFADEHSSESVRVAMEEGFKSAGIDSDVRILNLQNKGAIVYR